MEVVEITSPDGRFSIRLTGPNPNPGHLRRWIQTEVIPAIHRRRREAEPDPDGKNAN